MNVLFFKADENELAEEFKKFLPVNVDGVRGTADGAVGNLF